MNRLERIRRLCKRTAISTCIPVTFFQKTSISKQGTSKNSLNKPSSIDYDLFAPNLSVSGVQDPGNTIHSNLVEQSSYLAMIETAAVCRQLFVNWDTPYLYSMGICDVITHTCIHELDLPFRHK